MEPEQSINNRRSLAPYKQAITRYIRAAMVLKGLKYSALADRLTHKGVVITPENLRSKVSKGMFSSDLLAAIVDVLGVEEDAMREILTWRESTDHGVLVRTRLPAVADGAVWPAPFPTQLLRQSA